MPTSKRWLPQLKDINESRAAKLREKLKPYLETPATEGAFTYTAIGHAHIDLAWLWPLRGNQKEGVRDPFVTSL